MSKRVTHSLDQAATARGNYAFIDIGWCGRVVDTNEMADMTTEIAAEVDCSMCKRLMKRIEA